MKLRNDVLRQYIKDMDGYLRRHKISGKMVNQIKGAIIKEAMDEANAINIDRIYTAAALTVRRHLNYGNTRNVRLLQELDKNLTPALLSMEGWHRIATECVNETGFVVSPASEEDGINNMQLSHATKKYLRENPLEWDSSEDIYEVESSMPIEQAVKIMRMKRIPDSKITEIRQNFASEAMLEVTMLRVIKEYTALILSLRRVFGFGKDRIRAFLREFDNICATAVSWGKLMQELDDETGIVIRSGNAEDRNMYEYLGDDIQRMIDIEVEEMKHEKK